MSWAKAASDQIRAKWIPHPKFRLAESEALAALLTADPGEVVCIVGPSRVGKSALVDRMKRSLIGENPPDGSMPLVSIVMENDSMNGTLSSKSFTVSALLAVNHPMFGTDGPEDLWGIERMRKIERTPEGVLRTAFENALKYRGTQYVVIDEAHHLRYARGGMDAAAAVLDSLKCLAARTHVVLILVGAYPLLELLLSLPHLLGRKLQIHFARYRADSEADVLAFDRILVDYSKSLHLSRAQSLRDWNEYLHEGSLGCIGLLRGWIRDALNQAWLTSAPELTKQHFESSRKSDRTLQSIAAEIRRGEESLNRTVTAAATKLGVADSHSESTPKKRGRPKRPFTANPRRFVVGGRRDTHGK